MDKKTKLQSFKVLLLSILICVCVGFVFAGFGAPALTPSSGNNIPGPLNVGPVSQSKGGTSLKDSLLNIEGTLASSALVVWNNVVFTKKFIVESLVGSGRTPLCVDDLGKLKRCELQAREFSLLVSTNIIGAGTVTSDPVGINCGTTCFANFAENSTIVLTAVPASGFTFSGWGGACTTTLGPCSILLDQNRAIIANFTAVVPTYELSVTSTGTGMGKVTSSPAGIDCGVVGGPVCSINVVQNQVITLTATADAGSVFDSWGGACSGRSLTCNVTMSQARSAIANFNIVENPTVWSKIIIENRYNSPNTISPEAGEVGLSSVYPIGLTFNECAQNPSCNNSFPLAAWNCPSGALCYAYPNGTSVDVTQVGVEPTTDSRTEAYGFETQTDSNYSSSNWQLNVDNCWQYAGYVNNTMSKTCKMTLGTVGGSRVAKKVYSDFQIKKKLTVSVADAEKNFGGIQGPFGNYFNGVNEIITLVGSEIISNIYGSGTDGWGYTGQIQKEIYLPKNKSVTLNTVTADGYIYNGWGGACSGASTTCTISMSQPRNVTASFSAPPTKTLHIKVYANYQDIGDLINNGGLSRNVYSTHIPHAVWEAFTILTGGVLYYYNPSTMEEADVSCGITHIPSQQVWNYEISPLCNKSFIEGSTVTLNKRNFTNFTHWGDACSGSSPTCTITMDQDKTVSLYSCDGNGGVCPYQ